MGTKHNFDKNKNIQNPAFSKDEKGAMETTNDFIFPQNSSGVMCLWTR